MSVVVEIKVDDQATPAQRRVIAGLEARGPLHRMMGERVQNTIRDHLAGVSLARHETANRLGASPSGFWEKAAENVGRNESLRADEAGAVVTVAHPGIGRAFHDVDIVPGAGKKCLTIPLAAEAYNQRAYRMEGLFVVRPKGKQPFLARKDGAGIKPMYLLVPAVHQKQDRTLMPSEDDLRLAALQGLRSYLKFLLRGG